MSGQETRVAYPLIAGVCAVVLVGGPIAGLAVWSGQHGKSVRHAALVNREPYSSTVGPKTFRNVDSAVPHKKTAEPVTTSDSDEALKKDPIPKLLEPKKTDNPEPDQAKLPAEDESSNRSSSVTPARPSPEEKSSDARGIPAPPSTGKKSSDRSESFSPDPPSPEEKIVQVIRAFIVRQLAHPDGFDIVDHTKPQKVKAANQKRAQVMRVVFRAQDSSGRAGDYDFLFVVQKDEVVEHAPTAVYVAAQRARQQAMLQVAQLNQAILQQQLRGSMQVGGSGGGCILRGG